MGAIATVLRFTSMVATKWRSPPPSIVATSILRERTEVNQRGDASRGERAGRKAQAPPEVEALPQIGPGACAGRAAAMRSQTCGAESTVIPASEALFPRRDLATTKLRSRANALLSHGEQSDAVEHAQCILGC